ncbi:MAG: beta-lactamase family protein, partial [Gemmatimonadetes bacterium]|nr:beta-lactamase family protein [Gemmatimonadota bacterium]
MIADLVRIAVKVATALALVVPLAAAQTTAEEKVAGLAADILEEDDYVGVAIAVGRNDEVVFARGFGTADLESEAPVDTATQFRVYSIVKPMTAIAAARLSEQGAVDLDAPVSSYLDGLPDATAAITLRQLIGHTGGVRHYRDGEWLRVSQR